MVGAGGEFTAGDVPAGFGVIITTGAFGDACDAPAGTGLLNLSFSRCTVLQCSTKACRRLKSLSQGRQYLFFGFTMSHFGGFGNLAATGLGAVGVLVAAGSSAEICDSSLSADMKCSPKPAADESAFSGMMTSSSAIRPYWTSYCWGEML
jgi:hypothetical protein